MYEFFGRHVEHVNEQFVAIEENLEYEGDDPEIAIELWETHDLVLLLDGATVDQNLIDRLVGWNEWTSEGPPSLGP